jgi:type I restriction enzyme M protein
VPIAEIENNDYDLSINRYKEVVYETVTYDKPAKIIEDLEAINSKITTGLKELKELVNG